MGGIYRPFQGWADFNPLFFIIDINECELRVDNCTWNTKCRNLFGSFDCVCKDGLKENAGKCEGI